MTATPPDPDPDRTPGLEPGGGVQPGDTPPDSASATSGVSHHEQPPSRVAHVVTLVLAVLVVLALIGLVIAQVSGLLRVL
ncbi:DUF6480 family protein [Goodfellowiella coeruleoviolacea]|nr:DUF6480 family protein [Goodfellowiella coeruleoviolacea]